jgi:hypothetical protein
LVLTAWLSLGAVPAWAADAFGPAPGSPVAVGTNPTAIASGDFNRDGKGDLAVTNSGDSTVSVLLGNGDGTFAPAPGSPIAVGSSPFGIAVGDFNGDGKPDLAVANAGAGTVSILLGNGNGTFTAAPGSPVTAGSGPRGIAVGDFNGDGKSDLVVADSSGDAVAVLLGDGSGAFTPAPGSPFAVGASPNWVTLGDFNGDGRIDLAVPNQLSNDVSVLLGNGDGTFSAASGSPVSVGMSPDTLATADLNGDGRPDLAVADSQSNDVSVLLGNGDGTFAPAPGSPIPMGLGSGPFAVATGDLNGDAKPDLVVTNTGFNSASVLFGNGDGTFAAAPGSPFATGSFPAAIAVADLNNDGHPDFAAANLFGNNVSVLLNRIGVPAALQFGTQPHSAVVGQHITGTDYDPSGPPITVKIVDVFGNVVTTSNAQVTMSLTSNPGGATLGGTTTVNAVDGIATFSDLTLNRPGNGYALTASAAGMSSTTSDPFDIQTTAVACSENTGCQTAAGNAGGSLTVVAHPNAALTDAGTLYESVNPDQGAPLTCPGYVSADPNTYEFVMTSSNRAKTTTETIRRPLAPLAGTIRQILSTQQVCFGAPYDFVTRSGSLAPAAVMPDGTAGFLGLLPNCREPGATVCLASRTDRVDPTNGIGFDIILTVQVPAGLSGDPWQR